MRKFSTGRGATVLAFVLGLLIATAGTATAAKLITGKQIKDGSIAEKDLAKSLRTKLGKAGTPGPAGVQGERGPQGAKGDAGVGASDVSTVSRAGAAIALTGTDDEVLSMALDPGAYTARAILQASGDAGATVQCQMKAVRAADGRTFTAKGTIAAGGSVTLPVEVADTWGESGVVVVTCQATGGGAAIEQATLNVTSVGKVERYIP